MERQRIRNLDADMLQINNLDRHRKPELVVHPSVTPQTPSVFFLLFHCFVCVA